MRPRLVLTSEPDAAAHQAILHPLVDFNVSKVGNLERTPLVVLIQDPRTEQVTGGLWGRTSWKWLTIETLFVPEAYRGQGLGSAVMQMAEEEAIRRGCIGAWVDTYSFQAPGFYETLGFKRFGLIDDYPPGYSCIFFQKRF